MAIPEYTLDDIRPHVVRTIHRAGSNVQADVLLVDWNGREALLKDYSGRPLWVRKLWAPIFNGREFRALRRLQGVEGVPELYAWVAPCGILMEFLPARRLPRHKETPPSREFFNRAQALVDQLHERGIAHGDLRRKNILLDDSEKPYLIDFETAVTAKPGVGGVASRYAFRRMAQVDRLKFARIKSAYYPDLLRSEERHWLENEPLSLKTGRFLKRHVLRYLRKPHHRRALLKRIRRRIRKVS